MESLDDLRRLDESSQSINKTTSPQPTGPQLSFAERKAQASRPTKLRTVKGSDNMRDIERPPPGDVFSRKKRSASKPELTKQRSNYFEDAFAVKEANPGKDRVLSESIVMADVKTNVMIDDEFTFITELSYLLSTRYQRPISSTVVTLQHGTCMVFGGTFDPAYVISVHALPTQLQPTTNKRNAALIQRHMDEALGVKPSRGFLRFIPTPEDSTARNGKTIAGEVEESAEVKLTAAEAAEEFTGLRRTRSKNKGRLSVRSFGTFRNSSAVTAPAAEPAPSASQGAHGPGTADVPGFPLRTARHTKSFVANLFGRS